MALATLAGIVATTIVPNPDYWFELNLGVLLVDLVLLVALVWIALVSDRWFPIWYAGLHLVGVASHLGSIIAPGFAPDVYFLLQGFWAIPMFIVLLVGVALDRKAGLRDAPGGQSA